jgi:DinB superfamily
MHHIRNMTPHKLDDTISLLRRTPAALDALLRDLPDVWTRQNEGNGTWTVFDVMGHLIHGEQTDWMPRTRLLMQYGETRAFEPFDMSGHLAVCRGKSMEELLDEFAGLRAGNLADLKAFNLRPDDLERHGRHPALGPVTLSQLLATWAAHDLTHLHQISRIMAHQYREPVGPWSAYMGVMKCAGHSSV